MRAVVQRVASASVEVNKWWLCFSWYFSLYIWCSSSQLQVEGRTVSAIGPGLLVLVGLHDSDVDSDADFMYSFLFYSIILFFLSYNRVICWFNFIYRCRKVLNMRLFPNDTTGKSWDRNVCAKLPAFLVLFV